VFVAVAGRYRRQEGYQVLLKGSAQAVKSRSSRF
jgi:hypothetical protein